jgi:hypothetical protein
MPGAVDCTVASAEGRAASEGCEVTSEEYRIIDPSVHISIGKSWRALFGLTILRWRGGLDLRSPSQSRIRGNKAWGNSSHTASALVFLLVYMADVWKSHLGRW